MKIWREKDQALGKYSETCIGLSRGFKVCDFWVNTHQRRGVIYGVACGGRRKVKIVLGIGDWVLSISWTGSLG